MKVLIVGMGKMGRKIAQSLSVLETNITLMDRSQAALESAVDLIDAIFQWERSAFWKAEGGGVGQL
jgi:Trk K+ transport system NAD-binding subunit